MVNVVLAVELANKKIALQGNIMPAHIVTGKSISTMVMVYVGNVAVAANASPVEEMVTNRNPSIIALPQKLPK